MTLKEWAICYAGALVLGGVGWVTTGNQWVGFGSILIFTAGYVLWLKSKKAAAEPVVISTDHLSRQQKRELKRKNKI
ncbi:hypothetical protein [Ferrovibrio sp.]|uniref:hypothetical protein n=1 Tax=Ferrovibrio sp. TaxID=1917215 RepID=UPI000CC50761|nr:hypothetical protein [Ferrovibrio sp.]PJI37907.1 MAG: hypothetical protein CTR53_18060 [Ferrovibrio sp.]